ncbi:MAG: siroheme synthase CysG [Vicinamibacterales bacterium]|nr:siroheme synthase CysG [Vicinamibacterales bacterium]
MSLFPVFIKLEGRPVLLVGAGSVGESKVSALLASRADVTVVAPRATASIAKWSAEKKLRWVAREFRPEDLDGMTLVIAAVPAEVAARIHDEAHARGILCNSVDDPDRCDFYYGAVVNRGDLQIAISTNGHSPALAQRLRQELERQFGPEYAEWVALLGSARQEMFAAAMDPEVRRERLHQLAGAKAFQEFALGNASPEAASKGKVYLVGAGPGDPELLTLKALRILGQADAVLHDDLLTPDILELIPASARVECVGKRHGERQITQDEINRRLRTYAVAGETVVRLKGGDGTIFGRASEEMDALRSAGIPFTIIPGVTAASGAAAAAGISLTDRRLGSALVFLTAQRCKGNPPPNWKAVAALGGTAAIYMPGGHEADLAQQLMEAGLPADTPCIVVAKATQADEQVIEVTLSGLRDMTTPPAPALLLIGVVQSDPARLEQARENTGKRSTFY